MTIDKNKVRAHLEGLRRELDLRPTRLQQIVRFIDRHQWVALAGIFAALLLVGALERAA